MALVQFNDVYWFDPFEVMIVKDNLPYVTIFFKSGSKIWIKLDHTEFSSLKNVLDKIEEMKDIAEPLRRVISG